MKKFDELYNQLNEQYDDEDEVFEKYLDKINFRYEDSRKLEEIIEILGYRQGFAEFLGDNPGAVEAVVGFISEWVPRNSEWKEAIQNVLDEMSEDTEEEDFGGDEQMADEFKM